MPATSTPWTLGVVDQAPVRKGGTASDALRESLELAARTEALGYARYWVAEHHNLASLASTSPEILIGQIAARTRSIRVGSGGVMLSHYSALKVAENFRMLESLYPGRVDLGLGRAPGGDQRTAAALAYPGQVRDVRYYPEQVDDLIAFLDDGVPSDHRFAGVRAGPTPAGLPEVWLLGSGIDSALLAAERGLRFSFAHFFGAASEHGPAIVEAYRTRFQPSRLLAEPQVNVAVQVLCADTPEEASRLASSLRLARLNMARGAPTGMVSPEEAESYPYTAEELSFLERSQMPSIVGDPAQVLHLLDDVAERYATRDLSIVTLCYDFGARIHSYELVAEICGLSAPGPPS